MPYRAASSGIISSNAIPKWMPAAFIFRSRSAFSGATRRETIARACVPSRRGRPAPLRAPPLVLLFSLLISLKCYRLKSEVVAIIISSSIDLVQFYGSIAVADAPRDAEGFRFAGAVRMVRLLSGVAPCYNLIMIIAFHLHWCLWGGCPPLLLLVAVVKG